MPAWWGSSFSVSAEAADTQVNTANGLEASDTGVPTSPLVATTCPTGAPASLSTPGMTTCTSTLVNSGLTLLNIAKSTAPNFTAALYFPQPWGHVDFSTVLLPGLDLTDGRFFSKSYIGYGGHFGMDIKPGWFGWVKDDIALHFVIGDGLGTYMNEAGGWANLVTNYGAPSTATAPGTYGGVNGPTSAAAASSIIAKTQQAMGAELSYQHWWLDNLRSNFNGGFASRWGLPIRLVNANGAAGTASSAGQAAAINKEVFTAHANLIWNPVSFIDIGVEYAFGQRTALNNQTATESVLLSKFAFKF
jgi:hypothetical protein